MHTQPIKKVFAAIATNREQSALRFLREWQEEFTKYHVSVLLVEDGPRRSFAIDEKTLPFSLSYYAWEDIENDLGSNAWIIPHRTSAIKSFAFYKAYHMGADVIIALDDDCYPISTYMPGCTEKDFVLQHVKNLFERQYEENAWASSTRTIRPRGLPYRNSKRIVPATNIFLSHGLWANVPDLDGKTQLELGTFPSLHEYFHEQLLPQGMYFPMCGMNVAWRRELTPAMYFLLMGKDRDEQLHGYDRFDDIWAGIFVKKILDHLRLRAYSGNPVIWHDRASNAMVNLEKERSGLEINELLWSAVDGIELTGKDVKNCYIELAGKLPLRGVYWDKLKHAMTVWARLF